MPGVLTDIDSLFSQGNCEGTVRPLTQFVFFSLAFVQIAWSNLAWQLHLPF